MEVTAASRKWQLAAVHSIWVFMCMFGIGFVGLAGFLPPPAPTDSAEAIARFIGENADLIRVGMCVCVAPAALLLTWGGAVAAQIRRIESQQPWMTYTWISANVILTLLFLFTCLWWAVAAFRPESSPEITQRFNDMAWLGFFGIIGTAMVQCLILTVATFSDSRPDPLFPRWFGYFQVWCLICDVPDLFVFRFKSGPVAWNGILACWLTLSVGFIWLAVTTVTTARAIKRTDEPAPTDPTVEERLIALENAQAIRS